MPEHSTLTGAALHEPKGVEGATSGQVYVADGSGSGAWATPDSTAGISEINSQTGSTYTLVLTDRGKTVEMDSGSAQTLTIPTNSSVAFPVGTWINIVRSGSGAVTIQAASGVVLNGQTAGSCTITATYAGVSIRKRGTNNWGIVGAHTTVTV